MNDCLVTRLKAIVNNPNLPVLETMSQFTLNAIAASGNTNMSDEQKWALNRFFAAIGADKDDSTFAKVKMLYLPFIAGNLAGASINYKTMNAENVDGRCTFDATNHGLIYTGTGTVFAVDKSFSGTSVNNLSCFMLSVTDSTEFFNSSISYNYVMKIDGVGYESFIPVPNQAGLFNIYKREFSVDAVLDAPFVFNFGATSYSLNLVVDGTLKKKTSTKVDTTFDITRVKSGRLTTGSIYYGIIVGSELTNDENDRIATALNNLKIAFLS